MGSSYNSDDDDVGVCSRSHTHNTFLERERSKWGSWVIVVVICIVLTPFIIILA